MNMQLKSQYELVMEQFEQEGKVFTYTEQDSLAIVEDINNGMEDFLHKQKISEKASELELSGIILNA
jgi:hypothetical protein